MKSFKPSIRFNRTTLFLIPLVLGCFALSQVAEAGPAPAPPNNPQNVRVVNTAADWLAPVPSAQSGTWNVGVTNTAASPVPVRDVDNPTKQPFQAEVVGGFADGASTTGDITIATVPSGKLLVIEYVSVFGAMLAGQKMVGVETDFRTNVTGNYHHEARPQGSNADGSLDYFVASQLVRFYGQPGPIGCSAERNSVAGANPNSVTFTISGYLVDCPTCVP